MKFGECVCIVLQFSLSDRITIIIISPFCTYQNVNGYDYDIYTPWWCIYKSDRARCIYRFYMVQFIFLAVLWTIFFFFFFYLSFRFSRILFFFSISSAFLCTSLPMPPIYWRAIKIALTDQVKCNGEWKISSQTKSNTACMRMHNAKLIICFDKDSQNCDGIN